jgi:hypothetical protein
MGEQRTPGERLQDLGKVGMHALSLAGGKDHDIEGGHGGAHTNKKGRG